MDKLWWHVKQKEETPPPLLLVGWFLCWCFWLCHSVTLSRPPLSSLTQTLFSRSPPSYSSPFPFAPSFFPPPPTNDGGAAASGNRLTNSAITLSSCSTIKA